MEEGAGLVGGLIDELVGDVSAAVALDGSPLALKRRPGLGAARARPRGLRVRAVRAPELEHEPVDDAVEVEAVVVPHLDEFNEIGDVSGALP